MMKLLNISKRLSFILLFVLAFSLVIGCSEKEDEKTPAEPDVPTIEEPTPDEPVEPTPEVPTEPDVPTQPVEPTPDVPVEPTDKPVEPTETIETILSWAIDYVGKEAIDEVELPTTHPELGGNITWSSSDPVLFDVESQLLDIVEFDTPVKVTCQVEYEGQTVSETYDFTVIGYSLNDIALDFIGQIKGQYIFKDLNLKTEFDEYGGVKVTYKCDKPEILSSTGKFVQPYNNEEIELEYTVTATDPAMSRTYKKKFIAEGLPMSKKIIPVIEWIEKNVVADGFIDQYTVFPEYIEDFDCTVSWQNPYGGKLTVEDIIGNPIASQGLYVDIVITINGESKTHDAYFKVKCTSFENDWEAIEYYVKEISKNSYNFTKWGYLPFVKNELTNVRVDILPYTYGKQRTGIVKDSTEYVVIHDTANTAASANAEMHRRYITNLNNDAGSTSISWHYTVDEDEAVQHLPLNEVGWHAGDGSHRFGDVYHNTGFGKEDCIGGGNYNGIGIESCVNSGSDYNDTMRRMAKLVAELLIDFNLGFDRIKQHWHFSGKDCPQVIRTTHRWELFIYLVQLEYFVKTQLPDVKLEWFSSDSSKMDNEGHIFVNSGTLNYVVKATLNGETKSFNLSTKF